MGGHLDWPRRSSEVARPASGRTFIARPKLCHARLSRRADHQRSQRYVQTDAYDTIAFFDREIRSHPGTGRAATGQRDTRYDGDIALPGIDGTGDDCVNPHDKDLVHVEPDQIQG